MIPVILGAVFPGIRTFRYSPRGPNTEWETPHMRSRG